MKKFILILISVLSFSQYALSDNLSDALTELSKKHNVDISHSPSLISPYMVGVKPQSSDLEVNLDSLLIGTPLSFKKVSDTQYYIFRDKGKRLHPYCDVILPGAETTLVYLNPHVYVRVDARFLNKLPRFSVKTNIPLLATTSPNVSFEFALGSKFSIDVPVSFNGWSVAGSSLKHIAVMPEFRYWTDTRFDGDFIGLHAIYAHYNVGGIDFMGGNIKDNVYKGNLYGIGIAYGHRFSLNKHFGIEPEIGIGYIHASHDISNAASGAFIRHQALNTFTITRLAVNACYTF